ncbi:MAG: helix-turn-helix transcriptional regulator [Bdellovibrio sp.]|nr:helix-turn-helix transcriptional regulator [Bdellovibrio sp.]
MTARGKLKQELLQLRIQSGLTQDDVAKALKYSTGQFISNWERGISAPPVQNIRQLARLYNSNAEALFNLVLAAAIESSKESLTKRFKESFNR